MGIFGRGGGRPQAQPSVEKERVTLDDPELQHDPRQQLYIGIHDAGLNLFFYGPGDIAACFTAATQASRLFDGTRLLDPSGAYVGALAGREERFWTAVDGPAGSAIVVHCFQG